MIPITASDLFTVARTVFGEARGEPLIGKHAVAWVIVNRHTAGKWFSGDTLTETCKMPWQFSCHNDGDPNLPRMLAATLADPVFQDCIYAAIGAITGRIDDPTGNATHYHVEGLEPDWATGHVPNCQIGRHMFYSGID